MAKRNKSVVVRSASYARGYSGRDHLLSDDDFDSIVGRIYPSEAAALEAAEGLKTSSSPVRVDAIPIDDVPLSDLAACIDRVARSQDRRGGAVASNVRPEELRTYGGDYLTVLIPLDHGPGEACDDKCVARVYRP